ncbi:hypothetical protein FOL47_007439 [Perkinsus chesapeaki]|uniref:Uncharacterized protein n=1 Tax=Perkinsus chesapeaki TaxID=330153 RepID=A0A7J6MWE0_PERCH|nr:hypothetical protein FOL47_007439 [Perkinsus chesapeaki]
MPYGSKLYDGHDIDRIRRSSVSSPTRGYGSQWGSSQVSVNPITGEIVRYGEVSRSGPLSSRISSREARRLREDEKATSKELYRRELLSQIAGGSKQDAYRDHPSGLRASPKHHLPGAFLKSRYGVPGVKGPMRRYLERLLLDGEEAAGPVPLGRTPSRRRRRRSVEGEQYSPVMVEEPIVASIRSSGGRGSPKKWNDNADEVRRVSPSRRYAAELEAQVAEKKERERREKEREAVRDRILEERIRKDAERDASGVSSGRIAGRRIVGDPFEGISEWQSNVEHVLPPDTSRSRASSKRHQQRRHLIDIDAEWADWYTKHPEINKRNGDGKPKEKVDKPVTVVREGVPRSGRSAGDEVVYMRRDDEAQTKSGVENNCNVAEDTITGQLGNRWQQKLPTFRELEGRRSEWAMERVCEDDCEELVMDRLKDEMDILKKDMEDTKAILGVIVGRACIANLTGVGRSTSGFIANRRRLDEEIYRINSSRLLPCRSDLIERSSPRWCGMTRSGRADQHSGEGEEEERSLDSWSDGETVVNDRAPSNCGSNVGLEDTIVSESAPADLENSQFEEVDEAVEVTDGFEKWNEDVGSEGGGRRGSRQMKVHSPAKYFSPDKMDVY